jgi:hypothetical protein
MASYPQVIEGYRKVIEVSRDHGINHARGTHSDGETGSRRKRVDEIKLSEWGDSELGSRFAGLRTIAGRFGEAARSAGEVGRMAGAECRANPPRVPMTIA